MRVRKVLFYASAIVVGWLWPHERLLARAVPKPPPPSPADVAAEQFRLTLVDFVRQHPQLRHAVVVFHDTDGTSRVASASRGDIDIGSIFQNAMTAIEYARAHAGDMAREVLPEQPPPELGISL